MWSATFNDSKRLWFTEADTAYYWPKDAASLSTTNSRLGSNWVSWEARPLGFHSYIQVIRMIFYNSTKEDYLAIGILQDCGSTFQRTAWFLHAGTRKAPMDPPILAPNSNSSTTLFQLRCFLPCSKIFTFISEYSCKFRMHNVLYR